MFFYPQDGFTAADLAKPNSTDQTLICSAMPVTQRSCCQCAAINSEFNFSCGCKGAVCSTDGRFVFNQYNVMPCGQGLSCLDSNGMVPDVSKTGICG